MKWVVVNAFCQTTVSLYFVDFTSWGTNFSGIRRTLTEHNNAIVCRLCRCVATYAIASNNKESVVYVLTDVSLKVTNANLAMAWSLHISVALLMFIALMFMNELCDEWNITDIKRLYGTLLYRCGAFLLQSDASYISVVVWSGGVVWVIAVMGFFFGRLPRYCSRS